MRMKNRIALFIITVVLAFQCHGSLVFAGEAVVTKSLAEVFNNSVIVPYHFQGKVFINGVKRDINGDYKLVKYQTHMMVPVKLISDLASEIVEGSDTWETVWHAQKPKEVQLTNKKLSKTIQFTANRKTMLINNKSKAMDVAPQMVDGKLVLPLRSVAEALGTRADWLNDLIVFSHEQINLQHPQTKAVIGPIRKELEDPRKPIVYQNKSIDLLTKSGNKLYFVRSAYDGMNMNFTLFERMEGESKDKQIRLPGKPYLYDAKVVGDQYVFISMEQGEGTLYAYDLKKGSISKLAPIGAWNEREGWLGPVRYLDQKWYVTLHYGDMTIGGETIYIVENGALRGIAEGDNFITSVKAGDALYTEDYHYMYENVNKLAKVDIKTGKSEAIGQPGYTYGVYRNNTGTSYSQSQSLYVKDDELYTIAYKENDPKDLGSVYRINLKDRGQKKLTEAARSFWVLDHHIYYIAAESGTLKMMDTTTGAVKTIVNQKVLNVRLHQGSFYYTLNAKAISDQAGVLYQYDLATGKNIKRSEHAMNSYEFSGSVIYYTLDGYEPGLYRISPDGRTTRPVAGNIRNLIVTEDGAVCTLVYEEGIHSVK